MKPYLDAPGYMDQDEVSEAVTAIAREIDQLLGSLNLDPDSIQSTDAPDDDDGPHSQHEKGPVPMAPRRDTAPHTGEKTPTDIHVVQGFLFGDTSDTPRRTMILTIIKDGDSITATMQPRDERPAETVTANSDHPAYPWLSKLVAILHDPSV